MKEDDSLLMDVARISLSALVGEVVMKQEITPFLAAARARGCEIQVGTDMLLEQTPAYRVLRLASGHAGRAKGRCTDQLLKLLD